jgi:hypothetical protein
MLRLQHLQPRLAGDSQGPSFDKAFACVEQNSHKAAKSVVELQVKRKFLN